jgi:hypothetical protein
LTETRPPVLATNCPRGSALPEASFGAQFCVGGSPRASFGTQRALLTCQAHAGDRPNGVGCLQVLGRRWASGGAKGHVVKKGDEVYLPLFMSWARRLEIKGGGKPFGQWKSPGFGYSDDVKGVQWNIHVDRNTGEIRLGVNLEGSAKGGGNWLITDFILSELARPTIESIKTKVDADRIQLTLACDAWQGASRYDIVEHLIGGRRPLLSEIDAQLWRQMLIRAKGCLDPSRQFRARARQTVTVLDTGEKRLAAPPMGGVSPHLVITTPVEAEPGWDDDRLDAAMDQAIARLRPVYEWVSRTAK